MPSESRSRREVLKAMAAAGSLSALPDSITRALAVPANNRTGTIKDVEHIVILTQENRSFDHYFGSLRGVRGFGDPHPMKLASGRPVWRQPSGSGEVLPYRPPVEHLGSSYLPDPPHGWNDGHAAWNAGRFDQWIASKGIVAMTYNRRDDIPYHFALADAFTVCDAYHCSLMGPTDPNRYHMWSGWVGNDGSGGGPVVTNAEAGYSWKTFPERLLEAGITWKVYQDKGDGLFASDTVWWGWTQDPFIGNYGDNSLLYFKQYQDALPGTPLSEAAKGGTQVRDHNRNPIRLLGDLRADLAAGRLPQVSWIAAPEAYTEHPNWASDFGAWYIARVLEALVAYPEVWSKTALFINYDEEGGFFDHMVPPTPPMSPQHGASTVPTTNEIFPGAEGLSAGPYGLGLRVPMLVVSPWSRGGWVNSQVFDHTSLIQFIEKRFSDEHPGLRETNIQPWRRAVTGDLTSAFNFRTPNAHLPALPDVSRYMPVDKTKQPDMPLSVPARQAMPMQEHGVRRSRALPYELHADGWLDTSTGDLRIVMSNTGKATAAFHVRSANPGDLPRCYTVEPGRQLSGVWNAVRAGQATYDLEVHGPNGFFRALHGASSGNGRANLIVRSRYRPQRQGLELSIRNPSGLAVHVRIADQYSTEVHALTLAASEELRQDVSVLCHDGWYDLVLTVEEDGDFRRQLAGRIENGRDGISDPALGRRA